MAHLTDRNQGETRPISSHRTVRRKAHHLLGQKIDLRYPQADYRCTVPGLETLRWRRTDEQPPAARLIQSPYDVDARYSQKRETQWVGYKVHRSETCDVGQPDVMTQVRTTLATTSDFVMGPVIQDD